MGRTKTSAKDVDVDMATTEVESVVAKVEEPLNLEQQVTVRSIAGWTTGFSRLLTMGDVTIPARSSVRLSRNEIISQIHSGNALFAGADRVGNHATLIIEDEPTIEEVNFKNAIQFSDELVKELFEIKNQDDFEDAMRKKIVTRAERYALMISIVKQRMNDFSKIRFCEEYTGYKYDNVKKEAENIH